MRVTTEVTLTGDNFQVECYIPHYFLRSYWISHLNKHLISSSEDYQVSTMPCIVPFFLYLNIWILADTCRRELGPQNIKRNISEQRRKPSSTSQSEWLTRQLTWRQDLQTHVADCVHPLRTGDLSDSPVSRELGALFLVQPCNHVICHPSPNIFFNQRRCF